VVTSQASVDLVDAAGDVALTMLVPGDDATVIDVTYTIVTAGTGSFSHTLTLEAGLAGAGAAIAEATTLLADGAVGLRAIAKGLQNVRLTRGTILQILNAETGGDITNGAIVHVVVNWQL
jgi:hypothetical protein